MGKSATIDFCRKIRKGLLSLIVNNTKVLNALKFAGAKISSPEQRMVLGGTALMSQPFVDLNNKNVDEETRKLSCSRTCAKIIAGTTVGVAVRYLAIGIVNKFTNYEGKVTKFNSMLLPHSVNSKIVGKDILPKINLYRKGLGTFLGVFAGLFTNFLIDAPLTKKMTGKFYNFIKNREGVEKSESSLY